MLGFVSEGGEAIKGPITVPGHACMQEHQMPLAQRLVTKGSFLPPNIIKLYKSQP